MTLRQEQELFVQDTMLLLSYIFNSDRTCTFGEVARTVEQQKIYVQTGRSKTMLSNHLKRCAIDLNVFKDGKLLGSVADMKDIGDYWESLSKQNSWGGNWNSFKDIPHFERRT
jgi:peptidoglycan L-alanyl-D-glutamate endopeptidase CwlK